MRRMKITNVVVRIRWILNQFLTLNAYVSTEAAPFSCPENQMVCPDTTIHQCVNATQVCDG